METRPTKRFKRNRNSDVPDEDFIYNIKVTAITREFKGQSGPTVGEWDISCDTVPEFLAKLWINVKPLLQKEVIVSEESFSWGTDDLTEKDIGRFVLFYTTIGRRTFDCTDISTTHFVTWNVQGIKAYIHVYSLSLSSKEWFVKAKKALFDPPIIDEKVVAPNPKTVQEYVEKLKGIHKHFFAGSDIAWRAWANAVLSADSYLQEAMLHEPPPQKVLYLFTRVRTVQTHSSDVLGRILDNVSIGRNISRANADSIQECKPILAEICETYSKLGRLISDLQKRFESLENQATVSDAMLSTFHDAVVQEGQNEMNENNLPKEETQNETEYNNGVQEEGLEISEPILLKVENHAENDYI